MTYTNCQAIFNHVLHVILCQWLYCIRKVNVALFLTIQSCDHVDTPECQLTGHVGVVIAADWLVGGAGDVITASWDGTAIVHNCTTGTSIRRLNGRIYLNELAAKRIHSQQNRTRGH